MPLDPCDPDAARRHPLLGPLFARPPKGVVPKPIAVRSSGKRVRLRLRQILRCSAAGMGLSAIRERTGFDAQSVSASLARMRDAGEIEVLGQRGSYIYRLKR